jgi:predicted DNA-binding transcriptional regulator YafY
METKYTYDENIVSDLYKEAFGSRPRDYFWFDWQNASDAQKQEIWDQLLAIADAQAEEYYQEQLAAEKYLEATVIPNIQSYLNGCSREDAIRHLHETYETDGDTEYLEFQIGVRFGYLSGSPKVGY